MREIKFRALKDDISNCNFLYGHLIYDDEEVPIIFYKDDENGHIRRNTCLKGTEGQFTGLYDKNGKEIYEGDLLHRYMNVYWKVVFENSEWRAVGFSVLYLSANQFIECEVVGNIHENPELLK